jgi:hypothetical protein
MQDGASPLYALPRRVLLDTHFYCLEGWTSRNKRTASEWLPVVGLDKDKLCQLKQTAHDALEQEI